MEGTYDDFETYKRRIWSSKNAIPEPAYPEYAYFCWRWDEKLSREGKIGSYPRVSEPKDDEDFKNDILESFIYNQEMYDILMYVTNFGPLKHVQLTGVLWDTYGQTPTLLLQMWKWAKSSDAFPMCIPSSLDTGCARLACKVWYYFCEKHPSIFKVDSGCHSGKSPGQKVLVELDPSLFSFYEKLWGDGARRSKNDTLALDTFNRITVRDIVTAPGGFLYSLRSFLATMYHELMPKTITRAIEILQISNLPDISFLLTDKGQADPHERRLDKEQNSGQFHPMLFAVAGSGKTQSIFNLLAANWGQYLVSGHISNSLTHKDSILRPRRGGASTDTQWLFELFKRLKAKNDHSFAPTLYCSAFEVLLLNRNALMGIWIKQMAPYSGGQLSQGIFWLLFQTTCTPKYDPFKETLQLCMVSTVFFSDARLQGTLYHPTQHMRTVLDEAQNELDPFWNDQPPLIDFITAFDRSHGFFSVSGTSLRMRDCQRLFCNAAYHVTQPDHVEHEINSLSTAFNSVMDEHEFSASAEILAGQVFKAWDAESNRQRLTHVLEETKFANIFGDFYFTKRFQKAKRAEDESTMQLLENTKIYLIPWLGFYHQRQFKNFIGHACIDGSSILWGQERNGSIRDALSHDLTNYHETMWGPEYSSKTGTRIARGKMLRFEDFLRERFTFDSLNQSPGNSFRLIHSDECFSALLGAHIKRLLRRIGYYCSLGDQTFKYEFWRVACPETIVSQSTEDAHREREFFLLAKALLEKHVNAESRLAHEWQCAADKVAGEFRQAFEEKDDRFAERRRCRITRYSALFRGRMRWSTVYIEHVFAYYLNASDTPLPIEEMAKNAAKFIKSCLKNRVRLLQSKGHYLLLKNLYFTAIRADLMHKPSIFPRDTSARMITEGFALLDADESRHTGSTYAPKQKLSEPIVVDAVIEYLRDIESADEDNFESVLRNLLLDNQDDASSFGKAAEYYFAWSLGGLFAQSSGGSDLSPEARDGFRRKIAQAKLIPTHGHTCTQVLGNIQGYDGYILEEPSPRLKSDLTLGSTITFHEWLRRVENEEFFPTFHFPSTHAGPDIVFCLKSQDTGERILCAFQIKTGEKCDRSDAFKLVRTLDPSLWFWTAPRLRKDLTNELENWKSHRILTALVITSRSSKEFFASESDFYDGMRGLQSHIQNWELYREANFSKAYKDLKSDVDKLATTASLPEKAISSTKNAKSLAEGLSQEIQDSDSTTSAKALINAVEGARKELENAATSIYKAPGKREDQKAETNDILMLDHDKDNGPQDDIASPQDRRDDGYYFVILDNIALQKFLSPTFFHLCKVMKEVETVKETNLAKAEEHSKGHEYPCPQIGCKKRRYPFKSKGWLDKHMQEKHPGVKRRKLNPSVGGTGNRAGTNDDEDVEMAEAE